jgi:hypothetical protein
MQNSVRIAGEGKDGLSTFCFFLIVFLSSRPLYDLHTLLIVISQALIAIGVLVYGIVLLLRLRNADATSSVAGLRQFQVVLKIVIVMALLSVLFGIRAVFFMYRPVTGGLVVSGSTFLTFAFLARKHSVFFL